MDTIRLASGHSMPALGLGTWQMQGDVCRRAVRWAVEMGYTHIDTAWMYRNQVEIGATLQEMSVSRGDLFITSKIWTTHLRYDDALAQAEECLSQLQTDYLDLLLIHWPGEGRLFEEALAAFGRLHEQGKVRSIGISNFSISQVDQARSASALPISVNQVRYHVGHHPSALLEHCRQHQVHLTAYSPLAQGGILRNPVLTEIAGRHQKTTAQVALRWLLQKGLSVIPKGSSPEHLRENLQVFGWELSWEEMERIDAIEGD